MSGREEARRELDAAQMDLESETHRVKLLAMVNTPSNMAEAHRLRMEYEEARWNRERARERVSAARARYEAARGEGEE